MQYAGWALCVSPLAYARAMDGAWQRVTHGAGSIVRTIVRQGEAAAERAEQAIEDLIRKADAERETVTRLQADVERLEARIAQLEARLTRAGGR